MFCLIPQRGDRAGYAESRVETLYVLMYRVL